MNKFYPTGHQSRTLARALAEELGYELPTARTYSSREGENFIVPELAGTFTDPETGEEVQVVVRDVEVVRTPGRFLNTEKTES